MSPPIIGKAFQEVEPGTIVVSGTILNFAEPVPAWGIVLPKNHFYYFFTDPSCKGAWPSRLKCTPALYSKYGAYLPTRGKGKHENFQANASFLDNPQYVGVRILGDVFSDSLGRQLNYEVLDQQVGFKSFSLDALPLLRAGRHIAFSEAGFVPRQAKNVELEMNATIDYFNGEFVGVPTKRIHDSRWNRHIENWVDMLRTSGFYESGERFKNPK